MSIRIMSQIWDLDLNPSVKLIALAMADHADDQGFCWPGMRGLSEKCNVSKSTVIRAVKTLEDKNIIAVERSKNKETGWQNQNLYRFIPQKKNKSYPQSGYQIDTRPGVKCDSIRVSQCDHNHQYESSIVPLEDNKSYPQENPAQFSIMWKPSESFYKELKEKQIPSPTQKQIEKFVTYHTGKGTDIKNPDALFMHWVIGDHEKRTNKQKRQAIPTNDLELITFAASKGITARPGESMNAFRQRVQNKLRGQG